MRNLYNCRTLIYFFSTSAAKLLLPLLLLAVGLAAQAQVPVWQSAIKVGASNNVSIEATATDGNGNVLLAGSFTGQGQFGTLVVNSAGASDIFVAKYNPTSGAFLWVQRAGGSSDEQASAIAVSGNNIYLTGFFASSAATFGSTVVNRLGGYTIFVTKLTDAGNSASFGWTQVAGGTGYDEALALAVSGSNVYVTGDFTSTSASFGGLALGSAGGADAFVAKLTDAGSTASFVWARQASGTGNEYGKTLVVSGTSLYVGGYFGSPTATLGTLSLTNASANNTDGFVAKLTDAGTSGSFAWAQRMGGAGADMVKALGGRGANVYAAGFFGGPTGTFGGITLANTGTFGDVFVTKLTDAGTSSSFTWAQRAGGSTGDLATALAVGGNIVYVGGYYTSSPAAFGPTSLANANTYGDVFVARLTDAGPSGTFTGAVSAGGTDNDQLKALATQGSAVYAVGASASMPAAFGAISLPNSIYGYPLAFLASIQDQALATTRATTLPGLLLFPNPAPGATTVRVPAGTGLAAVQVLDALGRVVQQTTVAAGQDYPLAGFVPGVYAVRVQVGAASAVCRLVVE